MFSDDLEKAKRKLIGKHLALVIVKKGKTLFETSSRGITGFLEAIEEHGDELTDGSVADRVAGKAVASLCIYAGMQAVYALTLSESARKMLENSGIHTEWKDLVESILDAKRKSVCPFESLMRNISNAEEAYVKLRALQSSMKSMKRTACVREQFISGKPDN